VVAKSLQKALREIKKLPSHRPLLPEHWENFLRDIDDAAKYAEGRAGRLVIPKGSPDYQKQEAVEQAISLLCHFGKRPTLTEGSDYLQLANTLYEAATGERDVDLYKLCRTVHREWKEANLLPNRNKK
jgi:hypothetical protein